tara:strand:+ start:200 stop:625 length:426 start_codon:yes stop_codon:yes gene_type:complete
MLDQFSNDPAPSYSECILDIISYISNYEEYKFMENKIAILSKHVKFFIERIPHDKLGSYTGWIMFGKQKYAGDFMEYYGNIRKRFKKLKNVILFIGKLIVLQKKVIEKLYLPGGKHELKCAEKYSDVLQGVISNTNNPLND